MTNPVNATAIPSVLSFFLLSSFCPDHRYLACRYISNVYKTIISFNAYMTYKTMFRPHKHPLWERRLYATHSIKSNVYDVESVSNVSSGQHDRCDTTAPRELYSRSGICSITAVYSDKCYTSTKSVLAKYNKANYAAIKHNSLFWIHTDTQKIKRNARHSITALHVTHSIIRGKVHFHKSTSTSCSVKRWLSKAEQNRRVPYQVQHSLAYCADNGKARTEQNNYTAGKACSSLHIRAFMRTSEKIRGPNLIRKQIQNSASTARQRNTGYVNSTNHINSPCHNLRFFPFFIL